MSSIETFRPWPAEQSLFRTKDGSSVHFGWYVFYRAKTIVIRLEI